MREIKDLNKSVDISDLWVKIFNVVKMSILPDLINTIAAITLGNGVEFQKKIETIKKMYMDF